MRPVRGFSDGIPSIAIEKRAVFDFLGHPSCLVVADPEFQAIELICSLVRAARERAAIVDLGTIARRAASSPAGPSSERKERR